MIRFQYGKKIDGTLYRDAGYLPKPAPGRKSKAELSRTAAAERVTD